ncbi:hypothetical protein QUF50_03645 [Thiotrichales bacterium HSG1]|nr:hypothetical protein [Thiotrichales bacterium HSG1]
MLKDKFIALFKAVLLLGVLLVILLFNNKLPEPDKIIDQRVINEIAVYEEMERLQRDKIVTETAQKYKQQVSKQKQKEYQSFKNKNQKHIQTLTAKQQKEQQQLDKLKRHRSRAERELEKIRQERRKLNRL